MRVLLTGARGQLGRDLAALLPSAVAFGHAELAIEDLAAVERCLEEQGPELVFNCAAYNAVDRAEQEPERALAVNARGAANLARACARRGARLVHFSTNYVFAGDLDRPYLESDEARPLSAYARAKLEGERAVQEALPGALVIRSSALYGVGGSAQKGGSFPDRILTRARGGERLKVVADQRINPTFTADLAAGARELAQDSAAGLVHLVADGCCTWHEFAAEVLAVARVEAELEAVTSDAFPTAAARPRNGCLGSVRVGPLRSWREGLRAYWLASQTKSAVDTQPM